MKKILLCLTIILTCATAASALEFTQTGAMLEAKYTEPSDTLPDVNGVRQPLTDLDHCELYYDIGAGQVLAVSVPATSPNGGGFISTRFEVPIANLQEADVRLWGACADTSGNTGELTAVTVKRIDRLGPGAMK